MTSDRSISATTETNVSKKITRPIWLVKIAWPTPVLLTDSRVLEHESMVFSRQGLKVRGADDDKCSFVAQDIDNAIKALIDAEGIDDIAVSAWKYYETDGELVFTGYLDTVRLRSHRAEFTAVRVRQTNASFPEKAYSRQDWPYLPSDGSVIKWNGAEITLRSR